jgi:hypothetical protein
VRTHHQLASFKLHPTTYCLVEKARLDMWAQLGLLFSKTPPRHLLSSRSRLLARAGGFHPATVQRDVLAQQHMRTVPLAFRTRLLHTWVLLPAQLWRCHWCLSVSVTSP